MSRFRPAGFRDGWTAWRRRASRNPAAPRNTISPWEAGAPRSAASRWEAAANPCSVPSHGARVLEVRIHLPPARSQQRTLWLPGAAHAGETLSSNPLCSSGESGTNRCAGKRTRAEQIEKIERVRAPRVLKCCLLGGGPMVRIRLPPAESLLRTAFLHTPSMVRVLPAVTRIAQAERSSSSVSDRDRKIEPRLLRRQVMSPTVLVRCGATDGRCGPTWPIIRDHGRSPYHRR
jgi:hypothetical protein